MKTTLQLAGIVSLIALSYFLGELGYTVHVFRAPAVSAVVVASDKLNTDLNDLDGLIKQAYKVTHDSRVTLDNLNHAAIDERFYFEKQAPVLTTDVHNLLNTTEDTVHGLQSTQQATNIFLRELTSTVESTQPVIGHLDQVSVSANQSVQDFNKLLTDPQIGMITKNVQNITFTGAHMLSTADQVETKYTHSYLHPSTNPFVRTWQVASPYLGPSLTIAAKILPY